MQKELFADFTIRRITGEIMRLQDRLVNHPDIKGNDMARAAVVNECTRSIDAAQQPWAARTVGRHFAGKSH